LHVFELVLDIPVTAKHKNLLEYLQHEIESRLPADTVPVRLAITSTDNSYYHCEIGVIADAGHVHFAAPGSIFEISRRQTQNTEKFNAVMLIPTGVNCEIGGHAGDAGPAVRLLASVCDRLITHPNAVNASDINEIPDNGLYVEGSVICRLMQGTAALQPVRSNRILVVADNHPLMERKDDLINAVNAARASYGLNCPKIVVLDAPAVLKAHITATGRAAGHVEGLEKVLEIMDRERGSFDAVALAGAIDVPAALQFAYFAGDSNLANPWGGVEAIYTHALSMITNVPSAHAPIETTGYGVFEHFLREAGVDAVDPRMAAEIISKTFLQCVLKGLHRSPKIIPIRQGMFLPGLIGVSDISCLIIPAGILGLPVLAALEQGINVIAVRENRNLMRNDLSCLPWADGQYVEVDNYLEAAGVMSAIKTGISLDTVRRPINSTIVEAENWSTPSKVPVAVT
jgi:hypothetical protein